MSAKNKAKAAAENIVGKAQEGIGDLTGDPKTQAEGQAKQVKAKVRNVTEDIKDSVKKSID